MSEAIPPLPNTPPLRGAHLKHMDNFTSLPLPTGQIRTLLTV